VSGLTRLARKAYEKVWGSVKTEPWYPNPDQKQIGEVWFEQPEGSQLLLKLLFTSEKLSVQVHPNDEQARKYGHERGKTEMWHILQAEPGAQIALGLTAAVSPDQFPEIEKYLNWIPVAAGQTFFVPAGTVHAIGAGIVLAEIQQLSDVTFRLYDYGRPRELHLEESEEVAILRPNGEGPVPLPVRSAYFHTDCINVSGSARLAKPGFLICLTGEGTIGDQPFVPGDAFHVTQPVEARSSSATILTTRSPHV
jgi:mannose-6-phosphate isomerase